MNKFLLDALNLSNAVVALIIVGLGVNFGSVYWGSTIFGGSLGGLAGLFVASFVCGIISTLILIERHLSNMAGALAVRTEPTVSPNSGSTDQPIWGNTK